MTISSMMLSGCIKLGPDFSPMDSKHIPKEWKQNYKHSSIVRWWRLFGDSKLNTLVQKAFNQNLDLQSAGLKIIQSRAILGISQGMQFPQVQTLSAQASATHTQAMDISTKSINFDTIWEMDIWGKYARGIESSQADLMASVSSYEAVFVAVIAEVVKNYIIYKTAQERLLYAKRNVSIQQRVVKMTKVQFNLGNVSELDMQQAKTQLYNTQTSIEAIKLTQVQAINALSLLLATDTKTVKKIIKDSHINKYINNNSVIAKYKGTIQINTNSKILNVDIIPNPKLNPYYKIDANLLNQRPDIKAAEHIVHSQFAKLGVEMSHLYPSFSLFGNIGYNSDNKSGSWIPSDLALGVSVGPSFSWDILNYDRIKNKIRLQDASLQLAIIEYNKKVLSAVTEVKSALDSYRLTLKQLEQNKKALQATIRAFNLSVIQYNDGLVSYQRLLTTIEKLTLTQDRYASLKGAVSLNAIALYKALGGGWQVAKGKSYISQQSITQMKSRTDWKNYLDANATKIPQGLLDE